MRTAVYLLLHAGFFTCGFHIAFLVTHLPGEVQLCGLPRAGRELVARASSASRTSSAACSRARALQRFRSKYILFWMYASRSVLISRYLLAPKTELTFYLFAAGLGLTWLATVPPTAAIVGKLFGTRYLARCSGSRCCRTRSADSSAHGWAASRSTHGQLQWMWYADMALAAAAALCNLPIREALIGKPAVVLKPA